MTQFCPHFSGNYGNCLLNEPKNNLLDRMNHVPKYPGEYFDENQQCEFVFGNGSKICSYMPPCGRLWCTTSQGEEHGCRTQHMPWADGTPCGTNSWCMKSECTAQTEVEKVVDGNWGQWHAWSECSQSCGGGIRRSRRECTDPSPSGTGLYCLGDRVRYESCNTLDCPMDKVQDSRLEQCQAFNGNNFNMVGIPSNVKWLPKYTGSKFIFFPGFASLKRLLSFQFEDRIGANFFAGRTIPPRTTCLELPSLMELHAVRTPSMPASTDSAFRPVATMFSVLGLSLVRRRELSWEH